MLYGSHEKTQFLQTPIFPQQLKNMRGKCKKIISHDREQIQIFIFEAFFSSFLCDRLKGYLVLPGYMVDSSNLNYKQATKLNLMFLHLDA